MRTPKHDRGVTAAPRPTFPSRSSALRALTLGVLPALALSAPSAARAANIDLQCGGTRNWSDPTSWIGGVVPTAADNARGSICSTETTLIVDAAAPASVSRWNPRATFTSAVFVGTNITLGRDFDFIGGFGIRNATFDDGGFDLATGGFTDCVDSACSYGFALGATTGVTMVRRGGTITSRGPIAAYSPGPLSFRPGDSANGMLTSCEFARCPQIEVVQDPGYYDAAQGLTISWWSLGNSGPYKTRITLNWDTGPVTGSEAQPFDWTFRVPGSQAAALRGLITSGNLIIGTLPSGVSFNATDHVFYDAATGYTYVGFPWVASDADGDGVLDADDICPDGDDTLDADLDGVPDDCDAFPTDIDEWDDTDEDGVGDNSDLCEGDDASGDTDADLTCDDLDDDDDNDGVLDSVDCAPTDSTGRIRYTVYTDTDGDGFAGTPGSYCGVGSDSAWLVTTSTDCDEANLDVNVDADEVCDGLDNDCDGDIDDADDDLAAGDLNTYYFDNDNDGFGGEDTTLACSAPAGWVENNDDCDDSDELTGGPTAWFLDWDRDGHGDPDWSINSCLDLSATGVFFDEGDDCDDTDDGVGEPNTYYEDNDEDGFGAAEFPVEDCGAAPEGTVSNDADCDDEDDAVGAAPTWYADLDGDTYGDSLDAVIACVQPADTVARAGDCDDASDSAYPGADETCGDLVDSDCDGVGDELSDDQDGDGVGGDVEDSDGADDCEPDDDGDGRLAEGRLDADYDGIIDYLDAVNDPFAVVNAGATWTKVRNVTVNYAAPAGANQMCLSSSATVACSFTTISGTTRAFTIPATNLTHTVYARFRSSATPTVVTTLSDTIKLDSTRPVDGAASATASAGAVHLSWTAATDAFAGVDGYKVVYARSATAPSSCTTGTVAAALTTDTSLTVSGLTDGAQVSFRVCAQDRAGNLSAGVTTTETPGADQTGPTGTVSVNAGAAFTGSTATTLTITGADAAGTVTHMCVSNTALCSSYVPFTTTRAHTLVSGTGAKTVSVWLRDNNNNVSGPFTDTITLDATKPVDGTLSGAAGTTSIALDWTAATDNSGGSGVASYTVAHRTSTTAPTSCAAATGVTRTTGVTDLSHLLSGLTAGTSYGVRVCAVDAVGNISTGRTLVLRTATAFAATAEGEGAGDAAAAARAEGGAADTGPAVSHAGCASAGGRAAGLGLLPLLLGALGLRRRR